MIPLIITTLTSLIAGVLVGGCVRPDDEVTKSLLDRNAQLDNQTPVQGRIMDGAYAGNVRLANQLTFRLCWMDPR